MNEKAADPETFNTGALRDKTKGIVPKNGPPIFAIISLRNSY